MKPPPRPCPRSVRWAACGALVAFVVLVARFWHPVYGFTVFFQLDAPNDPLKITAFRELPVYVHRDTGGYDGLYYAQIAHDPSLRDPELPRAMDNFSYRARRILPPALAWLLGAGQPAWIIHTYSLINVAAWFALAAVLWRLLGVSDIRGLLAWGGVLFSAGALSSVRLALTDLVALAVLAGALLAAECWRGRAAVALLSLAGLARETSLLAVTGLCKSPWLSKKNLARLGLVALPLIVWLGYIRWRVGPADAGWGNFTWPGAGWFEKGRAAFAALTTVPDKPLAWTTLLATVALTVQAAYFVVRRRPTERWWRIGAAYAVMLLFLGTAVWEGFPGAATRVLLPLTLAFNVVAHRARASFAWLIAGNLSVFAGLLALRDVPHDPSELAARRVGHATAVVRTTEDWFTREHDRRHAWQWTRRDGRLTLETHSLRSGTVRLEFGLRSLVTRTVVLRQDSREVWHGEIGPALSQHVVTLPARPAGVTSLTFSTDTRGVPENATPGARELAFALYDVRLALPQP